MTIDFALIYKSLPFLLVGARTAVIVTFWSVLVGNCLGLLVALGRLSRVRWISSLAGAYVAFLRGTPMVVQIFIVYFGLPRIGIYLPPLLSGVTALGLNSGAYLGEIFRGGIQSIEVGQTQAALSLGLKPAQVMRYILLPQAFVRVLPSIGNEFVTLIKDSSLVSFIAVQELTYRSTLVAARTYDYFSMYMATAAIYFCLTYAVSQLLGWLERRLTIK